MIRLPSLEDLLTMGENRKKSLSDSTVPSNVLIRNIDDIPKLHYADKITEIILDEELKNESRFLSGDFTIDYVDEKNYTCAYTLYFQDDKNEGYKLEAKTKLLDITKLSEEAIQDLSNNKSIKFEIPVPSKKDRSRYKIVSM